MPCIKFQLTAAYLTILLRAVVIGGELESQTRCVERR
jgi:hypothetical protein